MLPTTPEELAARRTELGQSSVLRALADRLSRLATPLLEGSVYIPTQKALLSRDGGVCKNDGSRLVFDPLNPHRHSCPRCGHTHEGERHHRAWIWRYHLWLSERAVHLALLGALDQHAALAARAHDILESYATRYREYPNRDNVLGPTRLFFSTYLESIWLIQLTIAASFLESGGCMPAAQVARWSGFDDMVRESADLIVSFDEGWSNRQVWNNAALIAAGRWLGEDSLVELGLDGPHGIRAQLVSAVSDEGMWFEGENYHFFALRGFLLAAALLRGVGIDLYGDDAPADRLRDMLAAPLLTILPDLTLPARGDAPFGVSLLQPRFAELWEVGWARTGDRRLESILTHLYSADAPERPDPGLSEIAEQEQNRPPQRLRRELLSWKALCWMPASTPHVPTNLWRAGSALLTEAGLAVLRPAPDRYVSVECGGRPAGHGHPDLLHLTLFWGSPLLLDFGTGSYVSPSLHWYRSTLAHNAPGVAGTGQLKREGWCVAFDQRDGFAWCRVVADGVLGDRTSAIRTIVIGQSCVLDAVEILADEDITVDLPIHILGLEQTSLDQLRSHLGVPITQDDLLGDVLELDTWGGMDLGASGFGVLLLQRAGERLLFTERPGPPDSQFADGPLSTFLVRRARGTGSWVQCYVRGSASPLRVRRADSEVVLEYADGSMDRFAIGERVCRITDRQGRVHSLSGLREIRRAREGRRGRDAKSQGKRQRRRVVCPLLDRVPAVAEWERHVPTCAVVELGSQHYRRSEEEYGTAGEFSARAALFAVGTQVCFAVEVTKGDLQFRRADAPDPALDNEASDIHSDGLQCYVGLDQWSGFLLVPDPDSSGVRVRAVAGTAADVTAARGTWERTDSGYRILVTIEVGCTLRRGDRFAVNLVVNEMHSGRMRRVGQLVLSGGIGWVYLRGDREHPNSAVIAEVS